MRVTLDRVEVSLGGTAIITGLSAEIAGAQVTALAGPSGSGKTTLLAAIAGEIALTSGRIERRHDTAHPTRARFAWIPQSPSVLGDRAVLENVAIGALSRGLPLDQALSAARQGLLDVGLGHRLHHDARHLSGGEQQRLAFARALAVGAPLILADEPTANLDAVNTGLICDMLRALSGQSTIVIATHDPRVVNACDHVVHLRGLRYED